MPRGPLPPGVDPLEAATDLLESGAAIRGDEVGDARHAAVGRSPAELLEGDDFLDDLPSPDAQLIAPPLHVEPVDAGSITSRTMTEGRASSTIAASTPKNGRVAVPGTVGVQPGSGVIMMAPVSVCHQVSTMGQLSPPIISWYHIHASGLIGSPTVPMRRSEDKSCLVT